MLALSGEGNGTPLQYSCLENPMDRGAWQATVYGIARVGHDWATKHTQYYQWVFLSLGFVRGGEAWPASGCLFTTYWRCRVSETVGLPGSPCFQPPSSKLEAGFWMQGWALRIYSKPFRDSLVSSASGPHFLVGHLAPHPLALPHLSPPCFCVTARQSLCGPPSPSPPFPVPCTVMSLPGRHLPLFSWSLSTSHQASADHHLPLGEFPDYLCQLCVPFSELFPFLPHVLTTFWSSVNLMDAHMSSQGLSWFTADSQSPTHTGLGPQKLPSLCWVSDWRCALSLWPHIVPCGFTCVDLSWDGL